MKPIKLTMCGFLAYANEQVIDFTQLGNHGLYLITGDTGAGKTTIFDAIMYALYGTASGNERDSSTLFRSKYASLDTPTFVELYFECNGKEYRIKRNPEYERKAKKGNGKAIEKADVVLEYPEHKLITKEKEVLKAIEEIVGLNRNQFKMVVMIAQGAFRELLLADTKSRQEIFRHIFSTDNYNQLQAKIKEDYSNVKKEYDDLTRDINNIINDIQCEEDSEYYQKIKDIKEEKVLEQQSIHTLGEFCKKDRSLETEYTDKLKNIDEELKQLDDQIEEGKNYNQCIVDIDNKKQELAKIQKELDELLTNYSEKEENKNRIVSELTSEIAKIEASYEDYTKLNNYEEKVAKLVGYIEHNGPLLSQNNSNYEQKEKNLIENKKIFNSLDNVEAQLVKLNNTIDQLKNNKEELQELNNDFININSYKEKWDDAINIFNESKNEKEKLEEQKTKYEEIYFSNQAGILAMRLIEGEPCPVCGSIHHPKIAILENEEISEQGLKDTQDKYQKAYDKMSKKSEESSQAKNNYDNAIQNYKNKARKLIELDFDENTSIELINEEINNNIQNIKERLTELEEEQKELNQKNEQRKSLINLIPDDEKQLEKLKEKIDNDETELNNKKRDKELIDNEINSLKEKLDYKSLEDAKKEVEDKGEEIVKITEEFKNLTTKKEKYEKDKNTYQGSLGELQNQISKLHAFDLDALKEQIQKLSHDKKQLENIKQTVHDRYTHNNDILSKLKENIKNRETVDIKRKWLLALDNTASGKSITDTEGKISLETYIQMAYFDRIINKANIRFTTMTKGQYTLERAKAEGKQTLGGLDLNVIDHYNGSKRSVKSLSGGEQFKASLSLALGLSDMIQESTRGLRLDCMFIDEGFGSLDDDSLQQALIALNDLSEGNRLVGIISHVNELKDKIDKQIVVTKDVRGYSQASIKSSI